MPKSLKNSLTHKLKETLDSLPCTHPLKGLVEHHGLIDIPIDKLHWKIWKKPYGPYGYCLTEFGHVAFERFIKIKNWTVPIKSSSSITSQDILRLDRHVSTPFFLSKIPIKLSAKWGIVNTVNAPYAFISYDESTATQLIMYDGDLKYFLEALDIGSK